MYADSLELQKCFPVTGCPFGKLLKWNPHTIRSVLVKCLVQWFLSIHLLTLFMLCSFNRSYQFFFTFFLIEMWLTHNLAASTHRMIPRLSVYMVRLSAFPLGAALFFYVLRDSTPGHHIGSQYFLRTVVVLFYILWYVCLMFGLESGTR